MLGAVLGHGLHGDKHLGAVGRRLPPSVGREFEGETEVHHQKVVQWMRQAKCGPNIRTLLEPVPEKDSWRTAGYSP